MPLKFPKPRSKATDKRVTDRQKQDAWLQLRYRVLERDTRQCRVCFRKAGVDVHHIRFRSVGGDDTMENCAALCRECHAEIHAYRLVLEGDANRRLKITRMR